MDLLSPLSAKGHVIELQASDPRHISSSHATVKSPSSTSPEVGFGKLFFDALNNVNDMQHTTMDLTDYEGHRDLWERSYEGHRDLWERSYEGHRNRPFSGD